MKRHKNDTAKSEENQKSKSGMKNKRWITTPKVTIVLLSISILCFIAWIIIPDYPYEQDEDGILFENPESYATSDKGWNAVVDDRDTIYCIDEEKNFVYGLHIDEFNYDNAEIINVIFGEDNTLFCHLAVYQEKAYLTQSESIWEIGVDGKPVREVVFYDYKDSDNQPSHQVRIEGMQFYEDELIYLYEEDKGDSVIRINLTNPQINNNVFVKRKGYGRVVKCHGTDAGDFVVLKNNGEIGYISLEGKYTKVFKASYDARKMEGMLVQDVLVVGDNLYMLEGQGKLSLYQWKEDEWELKADVKKEIGYDDEDSIYEYGLGEYEGSLSVFVNNEIYVIDSDNKLVPCTEQYDLSAGIKACIILKDVALFLGIICLLLGAVLGIGNIMKWRFSLLSKQILSTIPIVCILLIVVIYILFASMIELSSSDILKETIAVNEIAAAMFDGDEIAEIISYKDMDRGKADELSNKLRKFVNGNKSDWSRNYNIAIGVRTQGEKYVCVASSDQDKNYLTSEISVEAPIHTDFYDGSNTFAADASYGEDRKNLHLVLMTPIYREDGSYDAVMVLVASQDRLIEELVAAGITLLVNVLLWVAILVLVISLVSAKNVRALRRAKDVVARIAGGDFSVRVEKYTLDEVGEICVGVNDMADQLEEYIEELKHNEEFYYKFVPEKFKELLNKEKFTDLALGDAQSEDLSILFCDIRAFSMNSEMMTAKESFEFVNKIYGKAGPIIRKHNGFIDKYIGDAVMALFESADDAVNAGIELYRAIVLCENPLEDFGIPSVKVGVGIHSGMARLGIVGEEERMSGTVIADTVNLSSRIESLTKRYGAGMIISKDTLDRMKKPDVLSTRYLGMVQVAGVNEVATLYEVMDCLEDEERKLREQTKEDFREAIRLFHTGDMEGSLAMLGQLEKENPQDKAVKVYDNYIRDLIEAGVTEYNIFRFKQK